MKQSIDLEGAQRAVSLALIEAERQGVDIVVTVVDRGGHIIAVARTDGASYITLCVCR